MYKWILVTIFIVLSSTLILSQQARLASLGLEVDSLRGEIYALEIPSLADLEERVTVLERLDVDKIWEGFNFPISLTGMRVFIGMFLDAIDEDSLRFNR